MQKLLKRNYIQTNECFASSLLFDQALNSSEGRDSVSGLKTFDNTPDANLTEKSGQDLRVPVVYVLNMRGKPLMPTSPRKARKLLKNGKAKVVKLTPFTIQMMQSTGETVQPVTLGVDSGFKHIGISAVSEKKELYASEVILRDDIVKLISERSMYRRNRRNRKTWYRKPRFLNRSKPKGWLAPSIQNKFDTHVKVIEQVKRILPVTEVVIEVASFDIQKIKNPDITGKEYQNGEQSGFWNVREYILHRDGHICQHCKSRKKDIVLNVHHLKSRQTGGDRPDNLITLCKSCHDKFHKGEIQLKIKSSKGFKAEAFMTMVRWRLLEKISGTPTYGYLTKSRRIEVGIPKSHVNDAFVIAGGINQLRTVEYLTKQVRRSNRKLFKGSRSHIKNTAPRLIFGFQRYDKVNYKGQECFVFGRRSTGYFDLQKLEGTKISSSAKAKDCKLLETFKTLLAERRAAIPPRS